MEEALEVWVFMQDHDDPALKQATEKFKNGGDEERG